MREDEFIYLKIRHRIRPAEDADMQRIAPNRRAMISTAMTDTGRISIHRKKIERTLGKEEIDDIVRPAGDGLPCLSSLDNGKKMKKYRMAIPMRYFIFS